MLHWSPAREDCSCGVTTRRDSSDKEIQRSDLCLRLSKMALKKPQSWAAGKSSLSWFRGLTKLWYLASFHLWCKATLKVKKNRTISALSSRLLSLTREFASYRSSRRALHRLWWTQSRMVNPKSCFYGARVLLASSMSWLHWINCLQTVMIVAIVNRMSQLTKLSTSKRLETASISACL